MNSYKPVRKRRTKKEIEAVISKLNQELKEIKESMKHWEVGGDAWLSLRHYYEKLQRERDALAWVLGECIYISGLEA